MTSGQETERFYSFNPDLAHKVPAGAGARTGKDRGLQTIWLLVSVLRIIDKSIGIDMNKHRYSFVNNTAYEHLSTIYRPTIIVVLEYGQCQLRSRPSDFAS